MTLRRMEMKVLMIGASGKYARYVVPALKGRGATVRALVTGADKRAEAIAQGADEAIVGNLEDDQSLRNAAEGMDGVFHINPVFKPNEAELGVAMVTAAVAAGVRKFTFFQGDSPIPLEDEQSFREAARRGSAL